MALINGIIAPQYFEGVRDAIAALLAVELANQHTLNSAYPDVKKVWVERFITPDADTEFPLVNVTMQKGDYSNKNPRSVDGVYSFNIDVYTMGTATGATEWGDKKAMFEMQKIMGLIRSILSHPAYNTLGLPKGKIGNTMVTRMYVGDKQTSVDALCGVVGRVQFDVKCLEEVTLMDSVALEEWHATIYIKETEDGFYFEGGG